MAIKFLSTPVEVYTGGTTGSYVDVNVSAYIEANTAAAIIRLGSTSSATGNSTFIRKNGSTQDLYGSSGSECRFGSGMYLIIGLDSNGIFEIKHENTGLNILLYGYIGDSDIVMFDTFVDVSTTTTGSYVDVDITGEVGSDTPTAAVVFSLTNALATNTLYLRKNGSTDDRPNTADDGTSWSIVGVDGNNIFEQKISATSRDVYLMGYFKNNITMNTNGTDVSLTNTGAFEDLGTTNPGKAGVIYEIFSTSTTSSTYGLRKNNGTFPSLNDRLRYTGLTESDQQIIVQNIVPCDNAGIIEGYITAITADFYQMGTLTKSRKMLIT